MHEQKDKKRRLGFMIGKSNATLPADEQTEAELDQEVLKLFYPNQETQDTMKRPTLDAVYTNIYYSLLIL